MNGDVTEAMARKAFRFAKTRYHVPNGTMPARMEWTEDACALSSKSQRRKAVFHLRCIEVVKNDRYRQGHPIGAMTISTPSVRYRLAMHIPNEEVEG